MIWKTIKFSFFLVFFLALFPPAWVGHFLVECKSKVWQVLGIIMCLPFAIAALIFMGENNF